MAPRTYEELLANYELIDALHAQARRERARVFHRLVFSPAKGFFKALLNGSLRHGNPEIRCA
jgi:hypothetical protein